VVPPPHIVVVTRQKLDDVEAVERVEVVCVVEDALELFGELVVELEDDVVNGVVDAVVFELDRELPVEPEDVFTDELEDEVLGVDVVEMLEVEVCLLEDMIVEDDVFEIDEDVWEVLEEL
jgi:hypothetical protein